MRLRYTAQRRCRQETADRIPAQEGFREIGLTVEHTPWTSAPRAFLGIAAAYRECGVPVACLLARPAYARDWGVNVANHAHPSR